MKKWEIISKIIDKETSDFVRITGSRYNLRYNFYWWSDDAELEEYLSHDYYNSNEYIWYYEWLEDVNRLRDEKISEILGENKNPVMADIFPHSLKIKF